MYSNYGEICVRIKDLMDDFQKRSQSTTKVETIAEMKVNSKHLQSKASFYTRNDTYSSKSNKTGFRRKLSSI